MSGAEIIKGSGREALLEHATLYDEAESMLAEVRDAGAVWALILVYSGTIGYKICVASTYRSSTIH